MMSTTAGSNRKVAAMNVRQIAFYELRRSRLARATVFIAVVAVIMPGVAARAQDDDDSKSNSRFAPRGAPSVQTGSMDATRPETIVLPWFSPGVVNQPTVNQPTTTASSIPQVSVTPQAVITPQSSVIQLPAFSRPAGANVSPQVVTPNAGNPPPRRPPPHHRIPEIDPASAANALTLLIGGVLLLTDRRKRPVCC